jgi:hypothetical protein
VHIRPQFRIALLLLLPALLAGCGYRWVRYHAEEGPPRVSVVTLSNNSNEAGVELIASEALRREILGRGAMRLVGDPGGAQYVVRGVVRPLVTTRRSFTGVSLAREYQVTMRLELAVEDVEQSKPLARSREFIASEIYLASADAEAGRKNRHEALVFLSGELARRAHDSLDRALLAVRSQDRDIVMPTAEPDSGEEH